VFLVESLNQIVFQNSKVTMCLERT
jgi:hypothetical protein